MCTLTIQSPHANRLGPAENLRKYKKKQIPKKKTIEIQNMNDSTACLVSFIF